MTDGSPELSIIVTGRNDGHAGNFLHRLQVSLDVIIRLLDKYEVSTEYIMTEWNPPQDAPPLREAITWPDSDYVSVRFIEVPKHVHDRFENSEKMPIFQFIAKNVGIRRASGEFVLETNADIIPSEALIERIAEGSFKRGNFYRTDRHDIDETIPLDAPLETKLSICENNVFRVNTITGKLPSSLVSCVEYAIRRFVKHPIAFFTNRRPWGSRGMIRLLRSLNETPPTPEQIRNPTELKHLHRTASGDFILMAREDWASIRGFPELTTQWHGDSWVCLQAAVSGLTQVALDEPVYHQEHSRGSHYARPETDLEKFKQIARRALKSDDVNLPPEVRNDDSWGLGDVDLTEITA